MVTPGLCVGDVAEGAHELCHDDLGAGGQPALQAADERPVAGVRIDEVVVVAVGGLDVPEVADGREDLHLRAVGRCPMRTNPVSITSTQPPPGPAAPTAHPDDRFAGAAGRLCRRPPGRPVWLS